MISSGVGGGGGLGEEGGKGYQKTGKERGGTFSSTEPVVSLGRLGLGTRNKWLWGIGTHDLIG